MQLIPVGKSPSVGQLAATPSFQQGGNPDEQSVSSPGARPGEGSLKTTARVIEPSYTVKPGDTLNSIAARHGTTVDALQSINNLPDRNVLSVGQKLVMPNQE